MENRGYKICPKCGSLSYWDSYFQKYMCNTCQYGFNEEVNESNEDEIVEYFIINSELNLSKGKCAAQVAHVATIIAVEYSNNDNENFDKWYSLDQKKIILRGKQKDLEKLIEQGFYYIRDNGLTECEKNSLTAVGLPPMLRSEAKKYVKRLQLL